MKNTKLTTKKAALAIARAADLIVRSRRTGRKVRRPVHEELTIETSEAALEADCQTTTMGRFVSRHAEELGQLLGCRIEYDRSEYQHSPRDASGITGGVSKSLITIIPVS